MSFLAYFGSKKNIVFNLRFSVIPRICQSFVGRHSLYFLFEENIMKSLNLCKEISEIFLYKTPALEYVNFATPCIQQRDSAN
jgi:hypothetical protein